MTFRGQWLKTYSTGHNTFWAVYGYKSEAVRDADVSIVEKSGVVVSTPANGLWVDDTTCFKLEVSRDI